MYEVSRVIEILREEGIKSLFNKGLIYLIERRYIFFLDLFALPYLFIKIKYLNSNLTLHELIDFAFNDCAGLIMPYQSRNEILELLKIVKKIKPKVIIEIGTAIGGTLFLFSRLSSEDATIISIDLPKGRQKGYYIWRKTVYKSFAFSNQKIYLLRMNSHKKATLEQVKAILEDRKCDFLFIDGDHRYEGVKMDFEMYSPLLRKGGIIALHDIVPGSLVGEVPKFWKEIKELYEGKEIVENWKQEGRGIGLIIK